MFTINLGPFSGKNAPEIHYHPSAVDRLLEIAAAFCLLSGIGIVCWNYYHTDELPEYTIPGLLVNILVFALLFSGAYTSVRHINFPIRISSHNVVKQYILVTKLMRTSNLFFMLFAVAGFLSNNYAWATTLRIIALILWFLSVIIYYVQAFQYK